MNMAKEPYFPFYYRDFMVSTGEMTDAEVGKYLRYLIHQWEKGSIPGDPSMIQTIRFDSGLWETLEPKFPLSDDGRRHNPRLEEIRLERDQYIAKRSAAGKVGAGVRWDSKRNAIANATKDGKPHGKLIASTSTSTSTTTSTTPKANSLFDKFWEVWPKKIDKTKCKQWWERNKPDGDLVDLMIQNIEAMKKTSQWEDPQYIPGPYRWLYGRRWEDEAPETVEKDLAHVPTCKACGEPATKTIEGHGSYCTEHSPYEQE